MKSILEGYSGHAFSHSKTKPTVAWLDSGAYTILGGTPNSPEANKLVTHAAINVVTLENELWERIIDEFYKTFLIEHI